MGILIPITEKSNRQGSNTPPVSKLYGVPNISLIRDNGTSATIILDGKREVEERIVSETYAAIKSLVEVSYSDFLLPLNQTDGNQLSLKASGVVEVYNDTESKGVVRYRDNENSEDTIYHVEENISSILLLIPETEGLASQLNIDNSTGDNNIVVKTNQIIKSDVDGGGQFNLSANIFNESSISTAYMDGGLANGNVLSGFVYYDGLDRSSIYPVGSTIQIKGTTGGLNDGFHVLTGSLYDAVNGRTEYQWAGMVPDVVVFPFGICIYTAYDGKSWRVGEENNVLANDPLEFKIKSNKELRMFTTGEYLQISTDHHSLVMDEEDGFNAKLTSFSFSSPFRIGHVEVIQNKKATYTTVAFAACYPLSLSSQNTTFQQYVKNSVASGGQNMNIKTDNSSYCNQMIMNKGEGFEMVFSYLGSLTAERSITFPDADMNFNTAISETLNFSGVA